MAVAVSAVRLLLLFALTLAAVEATARFSGGAISFEFIEAKTDANTYKARLTALTSWQLGTGPCGPGCGPGDVGKSIRDWRLQITANNSVYFGNWTAEKRLDTYSTAPLYEHMTNYVNSEIKEQVFAVSTNLHTEQEVAFIDVDIEPQSLYTDITLMGESWRPFDLDSASIVDKNHARYVLQGSIRPWKRSDTNWPNSSPLVLLRPLYSVRLNANTTIRLTALDRDGDMVQCRAAKRVETGGITTPNVFVNTDCSIQVNTFDSWHWQYFRDGDLGVVSVVLSDYNRHDVYSEAGDLFEAYHAAGLSDVVVNFMIQVSAELRVPEFVAPTADSQHVFTVYVGARLSIRLFARPSNSSSPSVSVRDFQILSLPLHTWTVSAPIPDSSRTQDRVVKSAVEWDTTEADTGDYVLMAIATDSDGFESEERSYWIQIRPLAVSVKEGVGEAPYFPFFPAPGSVTCQQHSHCVVPIFVKPGNKRHAIVSVNVVAGLTDKASVSTSNVTKTNYGGQDFYQSDVVLQIESYGNFSVCLEATDDYGLKYTECFGVSVLPPDPCESGPCQHGGTCIRNGTSYVCQCPPPYDLGFPTYTGSNCDMLGTDRCGEHFCQPNTTVDCMDDHSYGFACACAAGYTGFLCSTEKDDCQLDSCANGGTCVDELNGFHCACPPGYSGMRCENVPAVCQSPVCQNGGRCVEESGSAVCKCPVGFQGTNCDTEKHGVSVAVPEGTHAVNAVVLSPRPGLNVVCDVGSTCQVPIYFTGEQSSPPHAVRGITDTEIVTSVSSSSFDGVTGLSDTLTSTLTITPQRPGIYSACVAIEDEHGRQDDEACYTVISREEQIDMLIIPRLPPGQRPAEFATDALPDGSKVTCLRGQPCRLLVPTDRRSNECVPVRSLTSGVYVFTTRPSDLDNSTCGTDILLETDTPETSICLRAGIGGETRCYTVYTLDSDPCESSPCQNGGVCAPDGLSGYTCNCPVPYSGLLCETGEDCQSERCLNSGVCTLTSSGFKCTCQPGFTGADCGQVPDECAHKDCPEGTTCIVEGMKAVCRCPLGRTGERCLDVVTDVPVRPNVNESQPHIIAPTPGDGFELMCDVGSQCSIPIFLSGHLSNPPRLSMGPTSPELLAEVPESPLPADTPVKALMASLAVTPSHPGSHHVCVNVHAPSAPGTGLGEVVDSICYTIRSTGHGGHGGAATTTAMPSTETNKLSSVDISKISKISCRSDAPCYIFPLTEGLENCTSVQAESLGVYTFNTFRVDNTTCGTVLLLDPDLMHNGLAVVRVGLTGDRHIFKVVAVDSNADPCNPSPCQNGGLCQPAGANSYSCSCPVPYLGQNCESVDPVCGSSPCRNGGTCIRDADNIRYTCRCQDGYTGTNCETDIDDCQPNSCENGGTCVDEVNDFRCECPPGFYGYTCHHTTGSTRTEVGACQSFPCQNGATCFSSIAAPTLFLCECAPGYSGRFCEVNLDPCSSTPCQHGGICLQHTTEYRCICGRGYSGTHCEVWLDPCDSDPCQNGGSCFHSSDAPTQFICTCPVGYNGTTCETMEDPCASSPCQYGGTCFSHEVTYRCVCPAGYTGDFCENWPDPCASKPCSNGGLCFNNDDAPDEYICVCSDGFTGQNCTSTVSIIGR